SSASLCRSFLSGARVVERQIHRQDQACQDNDGELTVLFNPRLTALARTLNSREVRTSFDARGLVIALTFVVGACGSGGASSGTAGQGGGGTAGSQGSAGTTGQAGASGAGNRGGSSVAGSGGI